jgi:hypothetical protein
VSTATNRFINWTGVTYTYGTSPTTVTITGVTDCKIDRKATKQAFKGDGDLYDTTVVTKKKERMVTITSGNQAALDSIPEDTSGTLVFILNDAKNGVGTGARTYTMVGAIRVDDASVTGKHENFSTGSVTFMGVSVDGTTDPLTFAVAS